MRLSSAEKELDKVGRFYDSGGSDRKITTKLRRESGRDNCAQYASVVSTEGGGIDIQMTLADSGVC